MSTIYDVAKLARVSIGTVSNYLNNKYVGTARSKAIKAAIDELHYTPNHVARALKVNASSQIMLILPNISLGVYSELAGSVIQEMQENGYYVQLLFTGDSPLREQKILETCFSSVCAGVLLCTCQPEATVTFERLQKEKPLIFLFRRPKDMSDYCFVGFDNYDIVNRIMMWLLNNDEKNVGLWTGPVDFSCERACVKAYNEAFAACGYKPSEKNVVSLPFSREVIFRQATKMFYSAQYPRFIIASSKLIADAIIEAAYYQNILLDQNICVISIGDGKWSNVDQLHRSLSTSRSIKGMAREVCGYMLECLASSGLYEHRVREIRDDFSTSSLSSVLKSLPAPAPRKRIASDGNRLRVVSPDCDTGVLSISQLLPFICESTGLDIDLQLVPVYDIASLVIEEGKKRTCSFDLVHLDNSWMQQMAELGIIRDITDYFESRPLLTNAIVPNMIEAMATIQGRIYGAPSLLCSQRLFYRKDFFEDPILQNSFSERYNRPLAAPKTWFEHMVIASFFTRAVNPDSPCDYGLIMGTRDAEMMLTEVFPRIWAYGGKVFDDYGNVALYSEETLQALRNYISCLQYCAPGYEGSLIPSIPVQFAQGNAAMMISYDIHACNLVDFSYSKVLDKIGFAPIPGETSTMGGWNYCVNMSSVRTQQCYKFLDCILSQELAVPYTLLGGGSPRKNVVSSPEVIAMYPWMQYTTESFQQSRKRCVPTSQDYINPSEIDVERVLANVIYKGIKQPNNLKKLLHEAEAELISMRRPRS